MAHPSVPFCNQITRRMSNHSLFPKKHPWKTTSAYSYQGFITSFQGNCSPGHSGPSPQGQRDPPHHTRAVPSTVTAFVTGFSLQPQYPSPTSLPASPRPARKVNKGEQREGTLCLLRRRVTPHRQPLPGTHPSPRGHQLCTPLCTCQ